MDDLEHFIIKGDNTTIVLVHDGIGCCSLWKDFPQQINTETGHTVFVYSRNGYGNSPISDSPFSFENEADILNTLLSKYDIRNPILFGHSCGAVICMYYAKKYETKRIVMTSPYLSYDEVMVNGLNKILTRFETGKMGELNLAHKNVNNMFYSWYNRGTTGNFVDLSIVESVERVRCPVVCIKYINDPYFTDGHLTKLKEVIPQTTIKLIEGSAHTIHKRQPQHIMEYLK
jgi:pimeloyl-ACP methyl ester carboxylesterase